MLRLDSQYRRGLALSNLCHNPGIRRGVNGGVKLAEGEHEAAREDRRYAANINIPPFVSGKRLLSGARQRPTHHRMALDTPLYSSPFQGPGIKFEGPSE